MQAVAALYDRQLPCQGAATPTTGTAAPAGDRAGHIRSCPRVAAPCRELGHSRSPLVGSQAMAGHPCRGPGRGQPPLYADSMHVAAHPPQAAPTIAANRCNKRMEKMKEVKRPPL
ncbi:hypothetical protein GW17_00056507 [Ensete ventricosum]|nr:hypothetical protein GW17_00056507 [Ensete ventricosum]